MSQLPDTMHAILLTGHGGFDRLEYRTDVPVPRPGGGEVLVRVGAAGVNNTDINTRIAWYSKEVTVGTTAEGGAAGFAGAGDADAARRWPFPASRAPTCAAGSSRQGTESTQAGSASGS